MTGEFVRESINLDLVSKQILSQMMIEEMKSEFSVHDSSSKDSSDKLSNMKKMYSHELVCATCLDRLVQDDVFSTLIDEVARIEMEKGRLEYLNMNQESSLSVLSKRL